MTYIKLSNGLRVNLDTVSSVSLSGNILVFTTTTGTTINVSCQNAVAALAQVDQILQGTAGTNPIVTIIPLFIAATWSSITPGTASVGSSSSNVIAGLHFSQYNGLQFGIFAYDGANYYPLYTVINSDTQISVGTYTNDDPTPPANTYNLYYSTDNGVTFAACGSLQLVTS